MNPRIYVACLAAYNAGKLHGAWIDADQDAEAIEAAIKEMLAASPEPGAEEWAIHDHEFGGIRIDEHESVEHIAEIAALLKEHGDVFAKLAAYLSDTGEAESKLQDGGYLGMWDSLEDYAENYLEETGAFNCMPENLRCYFDYERFARDLEMGGDVFTIVAPNGMIYVFDGH